VSNISVRILPFAGNGIAERNRDTLELKLPIITIHDLASEIEAIAEMRTDGNAIPHIHLEPVYIISSETVSDIVFEQI